MQEITDLKGLGSKFATTLAPERTIAQSLLLLVVRLYWGWQFFQNGKGKLTNLAKIQYLRRQ